MLSAPGPGYGTSHCHRSLNSSWPERKGQAKAVDAAPGPGEGTSHGGICCSWSERAGLTTEAWRLRPNAKVRAQRRKGS